VIYLDYQATTPLAPEAKAAMLPWLDRFGNPHSPHRAGREAAAAVEAARTRIAAHLPAGGRLFFTGGATESANWAIRAYAGRRIVVAATEHACVLETARAVAGELVVLPVGRDGLVDLAEAARAIGDGTALVATMLVNNEIGVAQPVAEIAALARAAGAAFLCDAVQGFGRMAMPDADMIAVSAHKIHGPKGIGALWVRDGIDLPPLMHGGGQEGGVRSGTLSPLLCAGFGAAAAMIDLSAERAHVTMLRDRLMAGLGEGWTLNGSAQARWPGNVNIRRDGLDASRLISEMREVAFSAGSACASGSGKPSHVLRAIGLDEGQARSSIRLGFGRYTNVDEVERAAGLIRAGVERQGVWA
jgi:cysteine desulfurase